MDIVKGPMFTVQSIWFLCVVHAPELVGHAGAEKLFLAQIRLEAVIMSDRVIIPSPLRSAEIYHS